MCVRKEEIVTFAVSRVERNPVFESGGMKLAKALRAALWVHAAAKRQHCILLAARSGW